MVTKILSALFIGISLVGLAAMQPLNGHEMKTLHDFQVKNITGEGFDFESVRGKKVMIVNVASECGLTPQYKQLQELYESFGGANFEIVAFPANNFGAQEPGTNQEIQTFCTSNYGVKFPMMSKISVKGDDQHELYQWLTKKELNGVGDYEVVWNFHKFLVDEKGRLVRDVHPDTLPIDESIIAWIEG